MTKAKFIADITYSIFLDPFDQTCQFTKGSCLYLTLYSNSSHAREKLHRNVSPLFLKILSDHV